MSAGNLEGWCRFLYGTNRCRADFRRVGVPNVPLREPTVSTAVTQGSSPLQAAISTETAEVVAAAVTQLPAQQRTVVVLRVWDGMSYAEIAEAVGRTEGTVRSHMHHGLASMRSYLERTLDS